MHGQCSFLLANIHNKSSLIHRNNKNTTGRKTRQETLANKRDVFLIQNKCLTLFVMHKQHDLQNTQSALMQF